MRLLYNQKRFELINCSDYENKAAEKAGLRLDGRKLIYFTLSAQIASQYHMVADPECQQIFRKHTARVMLSRGTDCDGIDFPRPAKESYLPFQAIGITYALANPITLIADEPGLGKTIQALGVLNSLPKIKSVLVICPAIIKRNWKREIEKWYIRCESNSVGMAYLDSFPATDIVIVNPDILAPVKDMEFAIQHELEKKKPRRNVAVRYAAQADLREAIARRHWDLIIIDECHAFKNSETLRTRAVLGYEYNQGLGKAPRIEADRYLFMSGTPMVNRPEELWPLIKFADPNDLGANWDYFAVRYCKLWKAPWGWDSSGAGNLPELEGRLRGTFMVRRRKKDVLKDLPAKVRQIVRLKPPLELIALLKKEEVVVNSLGSRLTTVIETAEAALASISQEGDWEGYKATAKKLSVFKMTDFSELSIIRKQVAVAKIPYAIEYIRLMLDEHNKVVVFAHHHEVMDALYKAFEGKIGVELVTGESTEEGRDNSINNFQENLQCRLIIISITICIGFQLTAAYYGLAVELDWRPTVVTQAEDRLHRIGQKGNVLIQHLIFEDSSDATQVKKVIAKQDILDQALG